MNDVKTCRDCRQVLPLESFYKRSDGTPHTYCKECSKLRTKQRAAAGLTNTDRKQSTIHGEQLVIKELAKQGIPALPGKALSHTLCDVLAWGCLPIEVKSSTDTISFSFAFTSRQRQMGIRGLAIILHCAWGDKDTFHIFRSNEPWFYGDDGKLKTMTQYNPNPKFQRKENILTPELMESRRDAWWILIEEYEKIRSRLIHGEDVASLLSA